MATKRLREDDWKMAWKLVEEGKELPSPPLSEKCPLCQLPEPPRIDGNGMRSCCSRCGFIYDTISDDRPEFGPKLDGILSEPSRMEAVNQLMPHASMNTDIAYTGRLPYHQYQMVKLNRWSSLSPMERSLYVVFNKIEKACNRHRVPTGVQYV